MAEFRWFNEKIAARRRKGWEKPNRQGKNGVKQSVLTEGKGVPLAVVISGANTHDVKLLEETVEKMGYIAHIRSRGEEKLEIDRNPDFKPRRWVVEACHSWLNRFRKLLVRFEKKAENYLALVQFACALIAWRKTVHVHQ